MKLRNKKTGEIAEFVVHKRVEDSEDGNKVYAQVVINPDEWEDYEEPKEYWYINWTPEIGAYHTRDTGSDADERQREIGNYFETKEEAEKAVEKLQAWKRLKDNGFKFTGYDTNYGQYRASFIFEKEARMTETKPDLYLLFGGEE